MNCHDKTTRAPVRDTIRELNDRLRRTGQGGNTVITRAVSELECATQLRLLHAIRDFTAFSPDNDPWGEHDFGRVEIDGVPYFWKVDYYDLNLEFGSPDPADDTVTRRILTIMTADDL